MEADSTRMRSEHDIRAVALAVARGLVSPEAARQAIRARTAPQPVSQSLHLSPTLKAEAYDAAQLPAMEHEAFLKIFKELWSEPPSEDILREDGEFGSKLVAQHLVQADAVEECLAIQRQLLELDVRPLPRLGDLLLKKGYLPSQRPTQTPTGKTPTKSEQTAMPLEAVEAAKDSKNLLGRYVRTALLGKGGMGEVWKAWDTDLRRWVALKFLKHEDAQELARFKREAQVVGQLSHPNIASIYEVSEIGEKHFIAMQYIAGQTFATFPRQDVKLLVELVRDAALAVHHAHLQGIIHRDLKPENFMVEGTPKPRAKTTRRAPGAARTDGLRLYVMDFGLAKSLAVTSTLSISGMVVGTPSYMSPEQARGGRDLDARTDLYALGATLYDLLADEPPFTDKDVYGLLKKVVEEDPRPLRKLRSGIDPDLETIVMKCLEKSPAQRYESAAGLAEDLTRWLGGEAIQAHPPSTIYRIRKYFSRRRGIVITSAIAAALMMVSGGLFLGAGIRKSRGIERTLADAAAWEREGRFREARDAFHSVLDLDPENRPAKAGFARMEERLAAIAAEQERVNAAIVSKKAAQDKAFKLLEAVRLALDGSLPYLYSRDAKYEELVARVEPGQGQIEEALKLDPDLVLGHYHLGRAWDLRGWTDKAEECWRKALQLDPHFGPAHYRLGRLLMTRAFLATTGYSDRELKARRPEAERLAREAAAELAAASASTLEDPLQAEAAAIMLDYCRKEVKSVRTRTKKIIESIGDRMGSEEFHFLAALVAHDELELVGEVTQAIRIRPKYFLALYLRGTRLQAAKMWDKAIADYSAALAISPRLEELYYMRALCRQEKGEFERALEDYAKALDLNPRHATTYVNRSLARLGRGDFDGAIEDGTEALRLQPGLPEAYNNRGRGYHAKGHEEEALRDYDEAIRLDPGMAAAHVNRGTLLQDRKDYTGAIESYTRALAIDSHLGEAYWNRALARQIAGEVDGAIDDYTQVMGIDPKDPLPYANRGTLLERKGDLAGAVADYRKALEMAPPGWTYRGRVEALLKGAQKKR